MMFPSFFREKNGAPFHRDQREHRGQLRLETLAQLKRVDFFGVDEGPQKQGQVFGLLNTGHILRLAGHSLKTLL